MPNGRPPVILVVDDDSLTCGVLSDLLSLEGYEVCVAPDGEEGLKLACARIPEVVLFDLKMPKMDGFEFVRRFRAQFGEAIPLILMTASRNASGRIEELCLASWIEKPFSIEQLLDTLKKHLRCNSTQ